MGYALQRRVAELEDVRLSVTLKAVLRTMADFADDRTGERACPSRATIARHVACSVRTVQSALQRLCALRYLDMARASRGRRAVGYRVPLERLDGADWVQPFLPGCGP